MGEIATISIRPAQRRDAADLLIIDNLSSHGLSLSFWQHAVSEGEAEDPLVYARERFANENSVFGWTNAWVAELDGEFAGSVTAYRMPEPDEDVSQIKQLFPGFVPVFELFAQVVGEWFIDSMGVLPKARNRKIADRLMDAALAEADSNGLATALVVEDENEPAIGLYRKKGFVVSQSLPKAGTNEKGNWFLMRRKPV